MKNGWDLIRQKDGLKMVFFIIKKAAVDATALS
jgi:hypothetical protein